MHEIGHVPAGAAGRQVGILPQSDRLAVGWHRAGVQALTGEMAQRGGVQGDPGQLARVPGAAPRIGIGDGDEPADVPDAITGHRRWPQLGGCQQAAVDHEDPVILAGDVGLHDDRAVGSARVRVGLGSLLRGGHADRDIGAVISVPRLYHNPPAEEFQCLGGFPGAGHDDRVGYRYPGAGQQLLGQHLVGRDVHADRGGLVGQRRADQAPVAPVAKPQHAQAADAPDRDPASAGRGGDRRCAHAEAVPLHHAGDIGEGSAKVRLPSRKDVTDGADRGQQQCLRHRRIRGLVPRALHHHVVAAVGARPHGAAQVHIPPGQPGQLERDMLGDVAEVGAAGHRADEPAGAAGRAMVICEPGQYCGQLLGEARTAGCLLPGQLVELESRDSDGLGGEDVGAAHVAQVNQPHICSLGLLVVAGVAAQYRSCAGPMAGVRLAMSKTHPAGSKCRRTSNSVMGSQSPAG